MLPIDSGLKVAPGAGFTRLAMLQVANDGDLMQAWQQSQRFALSTPQVEAVLKSAVVAGTSVDATWAGSLVDYRALSRDFIALIDARTLLGRIASNMRTVPFHVPVLRTLSGTSASWVGQGKAVPFSAPSFGRVTLASAKIQCAIAVTSELVRKWSLASEAAVRADMLRTIVQYMDAQFLDPSIAAVQDVSPGSITSGVTPTASTGNTVAAITSDLTTMMQGLIDDGSDLAGAAFALHPRCALYLSTLRDASGALAFPGIGVLGGQLMGLPAYASLGVPINSDDSPGPFSMVALIDAPRLLLADDGLMVVDGTRVASLQVSDNPSDTATTEATLSLWQSDLAAIRTTRWINWARGDDTDSATHGVAVLSEVRWGL